MKTLTCDVCRHTMKDPIPNRNYFHIAHMDICEECKDELEFSIKATVRNKDPFNYMWYSKLMMDNLDKAVQKGKF